MNLIESFKDGELQAKSLVELSQLWGAMADSRARQDTYAEIAYILEQKAVSLFKNKKDKEAAIMRDMSDRLRADADRLLLNYQEEYQNKHRQMLDEFRWRDGDKEWKTQMPTSQQL